MLIQQLNIDFSSILLEISQLLLHCFPHAGLKLSSYELTGTGSAV